MEPTIQNISELRGAIAELKTLEQKQSADIGLRFSSPSAIFHTLVSIFPKSADGSGSFFKQDIFGLLSRVLLPLTLNKTIFRNSNFLVKTLVGFVSQKASHLVNEQAVLGLWDKVRSVFEKKNPKGYSIPSESKIS